MSQEKSSPVRGFLQTPKGSLLVILLLLAAVASFRPESGNGWLNIGVAIAVAVGVDLLFASQQERNQIFPDGAALTGLIVALVLSAAVPYYLCAIAAGVAILSKHIFKVKRRPVFNPAAIGLAAALLFSGGQSWWGGLSLLPASFTLILLIGGALITHRVNKFPLVLSFLGLYFGLFLTLALLQAGGVADTLRMPVTNAVLADALRMPFTNAALFLAFFMLTDPPTSPARYGDQVRFGAIAALVSVALYLTLGGLSFLLVGLLAANAWNAWRAWSPARNAPSSEPSESSSPATGAY